MHRRREDKREGVMVRVEDGCAEEVGEGWRVGWGGRNKGRCTVLLCGALSSTNNIGRKG